MNAHIVLVTSLATLTFACAPTEEEIVDLGLIAADDDFSFDVGALEPGESTQLTFTVTSDVQLRIDQRKKGVEPHFIALEASSSSGAAPAHGDVSLDHDGLTDGTMSSKRPILILRDVAGETKFDLTVHNLGDRRVEKAEILVERPFGGDCQDYVDRFFSAGTGVLVAQCDVVVKGAASDPLLEITAANVCLSRVGSWGGAVHGFIEWRQRMTGEVGRYEGELIRADNEGTSWHERSEIGDSGEEVAYGAEAVDRRVRWRYDYLAGERVLSLNRTTSFLDDPFPTWRPDARSTLSCESLYSAPPTMGPLSEDTPVDCAPREGESDPSCP